MQVYILPESKTRIDKWLWTVRIFKSRTIATDACKAGKVKINGSEIKPSASVSRLDKIEVRKNGFNFQFEVKELLKNRVPAPIAKECFQNNTPASELEKANKPAFDAIIKKGIYLPCYVGGEKGGVTQSPTISAVGYNSLLTGTWTNKHGVVDNAIKNPNYNYPTIFKVFKEAYPTKKIGVFSTWLDNRTKLVGDNLPQTDKLTTDFYFDGLEPQDLANAIKNWLALNEQQLAPQSSGMPYLSWQQSAAQLISLI